MINFFSQLFIRNWPRKAVSLGFAIIIWILVGQSVTITRTLTNIPIRIVDLEPEQTVLGLQKNGLLSKKVSLTITGNKSTVQDLRSTNLEVVISVTGHSESWIATIDKCNLVTLDHEINIRKEIHSVDANDVSIRLTQYVTEDIVITVTTPIGSPPKGYEYLDIWPKYLNQKVSGPKEYVNALKEQGLELTFNLNKISFEELERNRIAQGNHDEIIFPIPQGWKKILIPFENTYMNLNDPQADFLRLLFLKQEFIPLNLNLPVFLFFPVKYIATVNPQVYTLEPVLPIVLHQGIYQMDLPLYVKDVSKLFLDVVKNNMALTIVMAPPYNHIPISWAVEFLDEKTLENTFLQSIIAQEHGILHDLALIDEAGIRHRFREYLRKLTLFTKNGAPLNLSAEIRNNKVIIQTQPTETTKIYKQDR
ncbi:hypothetical protein [Candidatus Chlamydia sanziniae]|uniref:Uncharacterized protein n=1 Tax=Candidatus Chlamydia sanziniae TaxID=1806891 RepID=A0A1A9HVM5_9CHLA|nr:hypothetical protein [Candidatus Chlamydia sanziniae]ANH78885.1 hypothetical protein Cs308_0715 [Candidatus Chlamydia sanziniae]